MALLRMDNLPFTPSDQDTIILPVQDTIIRPPTHSDIKIKTIEQLRQEALSTEFDYNEPIPQDEVWLHYWCDGIRYPLCGRGMFGVITGPPKAGKTTVLSNICASHLVYGKEQLNFEFNVPGTVLYVDTEQSKMFYQLTQKRVHETANVRENVQRYKALLLRAFSPNDRAKIIEDFIYNVFPDLSCVIIDGIADLTDDNNDIKKGQMVVHEIMRWTMQKNIMILGVLHKNKGDDKIRGHTGGETERKADFVPCVQETKNPGEFEISFLLCRYKKPPSMLFERTDTGVTYIKGASEYSAPF